MNNFPVLFQFGVLHYLIMVLDSGELLIERM